MNLELTPAFILHQRPFRETSLLLDVFSEHHGRVSLVAKGVRQKKRSQIGLYQLYQPLLLSWVGRGELHTLSNIEAASPRYILQAQSALCGLYINELMVKLLPLNEPEPDIFEAYRNSLSGLQSGNTEITLRLFEKQLLSHLGYGLVLDREFENDQLVEQQQQYYYQPDSGLHLWQQDKNQPSISGRSLQHLMTERDFDQESLFEIKQLMRTVIHFYMGGKPLKSRELFAQLQQYSSQTVK